MNSHELIELIQQPQNLSKDNINNYVDQAFDLLKKLNQANWDKSAIQQVAKFIAANADDQQLQHQFIEWKNNFNQIGNDIFNQYLQSSDTKNEDKVNLVLNKLGAHLTDDNDILLLDHSFDDNLSPLNSFWNTWAQLVQNTFPDGLKLTDNLTKMVHQLRYYIATHIANYLTSKFTAPNTKAIGSIIKFDKYLKKEHLPLTYQGNILEHSKQAKTTNKGFFSMITKTNICRIINEHIEMVATLYRDSEFLLLPIDKLIYDDLNQYIKGLPDIKKDAIVNTSQFNYAKLTDTDEVKQKFDIDAKINDPKIKQTLDQQYIPVKENDQLMEAIRLQYEKLLEIDDAQL